MIAYSRKAGLPVLEKPRHAVTLNFPTDWKREAEWRRAEVEALRGSVMFWRLSFVALAFTIGVLALS